MWNINHFIVSQVNPHVLPFLRSLSSTPSAYSASLLFSIIPRTIEFLSSSIKSTLLNVLSSIALPFQSPIRFLLDQTYIGDITITPPINAGDYTLLLKNPDPTRLHDCLRASEQSTWKMMSMIRGACEIEMALDDGVRRMRGQLILQEMQEARKVERLSRVRSWSTDFDGRKREREEGKGEGEDDGEDSEVESEYSYDIREEVDGDGTDPSPADGSLRPHSQRSGTSRQKVGRRPLRAVKAEPQPPSPEAPIRRRSAPAPSSSWMSSPPSLASPHHHAHSQPGSTHSSQVQLHLPSTTQEHASYISALDGKNAASTMAHRSTGESVAHAYVLANKVLTHILTPMTTVTHPSYTPQWRRLTLLSSLSLALCPSVQSMKREALKRGATDGPITGSHTTTDNGGTRTAATTPRRRNSVSRDVSTTPRARTPPAPSSDAALSYEELITSRQSSARLQQLLRGGTKRTSPSLMSRSDDSASSSSASHEPSPVLSITLPLPPGAGQPSLPSSPNEVHSLTVPSLVQFRPVEKRHLSTLDLQRLGAGKGEGGDGTDSDVEEERLWNEMMVRSDSDEDEDEEEAERVGSGAAVRGEVTHAPSARPPLTVAQPSGLSYLTSLLPFTSMYRSMSSIEPKGAQRNSTQPPSVGSSPGGRHSASHGAMHDTAARLGGGGERGERKDENVQLGWRRMPRTLSLSEVAGDIASIP